MKKIGKKHAAGAAGLPPSSAFAAAVFVSALFVLISCAVPAFAADIMDASKLGFGMARVSFDIGRLGRTVGFGSGDDSEPKYDIPRMIRADPGLSEYGMPGIIWLKHTLIRAAGESPQSVLPSALSGGPESPVGGTTTERLFVIRGREGIGSEWLNWNIQTPSNGSAEVSAASVYSVETGEKLRDVKPEYSAESGIYTVSFGEMRGDFIIVIEWRETVPEALYADGLVWFQESLPVWESVVEIRPSSPDSVRCRAFPYNVSPDREKRGGTDAFLWHEVNCPPTADGLSVSSRRGVAFSMRGDESALVRVMRDVSDAYVPRAPAEAVSGFGKSASEGIKTLLGWLHRQPEIRLADGTARRMPDSAPWSRREKITAAERWLRENGVDARMRWHLPITPDEDPPASPALLSDALLEIPVFKGSSRTQSVMYYNMDSAPSDSANSPLLSGSAVYGLSEEGRIVRRRIPDVKAAENRLSSSMKLKLDENGMLSGAVRLTLGGAWRPFFISSPEPSPEEARALLRGLFGDIRGISDVRCGRQKDGIDISFSLSGMAGVMSSGGGNILMSPPFLAPEVFTGLEKSTEAVIELRFPFVIEQNITVAMPKNFERVLIPSMQQPVSGKVSYTESMRQRRSSLSVDAKCEVGVGRAEGEHRNNLIRCIALWKNFSSRQIPVQLKIKK